MTDYTEDAQKRLEKEARSTKFKTGRPPALTFLYMRHSAGVFHNPINLRYRKTHVRTFSRQWI